jgi:hypothetical protein
MTSKINLAKIFQDEKKKAKNADLSIEDIIDDSSTENDEYNYLHNETIYSITQKKKKALQKLELDDIESMMQKLESYHLIEETYQFCKNKYVIAINKETKKITYGMFIDIEFKDRGMYVYLLCNHFRKKLSPFYDNFIFFQKMKEDEIVYLLLKSSSSSS